MNIFADESVNQPIVERLRQAGHLVLAVAELAPSISDEEVLTLANGSHSILLTADKDFGELVFRLKRVANGVILIRLKGLSLDAQSDLVVNTIASYIDELAGNFTVVTPGNIRIRPATLD